MLVDSNRGKVVVRRSPMTLAGVEGAVRWKLREAYQVSSPRRSKTKTAGERQDNMTRLQGMATRLRRIRRQSRCYVAVTGPSSKYNMTNSIGQVLY